MSVPERITSTDKIAEASRAFNAVADVVSIDGLIVDANSGEVIEWPTGITGDRFEWLTFRAVQAQANIDGWKQMLVIIHQALGLMLSEAGQRSIRTPYGTPRWASRLDREAPAERLPQVAQECELSPEAVKALLATAKKLDPKGIEALPEDLVPAEAKRMLIVDLPRGPWVQIDKPREQAPTVERVEASREWPASRE